MAICTCCNCVASHVIIVFLCLLEYFLFADHSVIYFSLRRYRFTHKVVLLSGVFFNIGLLGYFKYADFFLENINGVFGTSYPLPNLVLPLAISFFTFQQIAYLVDCSRENANEYDFLNYCLFVSFFPQLIAGPIVHHQEMMPQFARLRNRIFSYQRLQINSQFGLQWVLTQLVP